jgi:hypothetical protein
LYGLGEGMMEIEVRYNCQYKEIIIKEVNASFETGLLDENESIEMANNS